MLTYSYRKAKLIKREILKNLSTLWRKIFRQSITTFIKVTTGVGYVILQNLE